MLERLAAARRHAPNRRIPPPPAADFLARIVRHFDVTRAIPFGSRARHAAGPDSDADVAVLLRGPPLRFLPTKLSMADAAFDVLLETGIRVQPLPV